MSDEPNALLRTLKLGAWTFELRRGDAPHRVRALWEIGRTVNGVFEWDPTWGIREEFRRGYPILELDEAIAEIRAADQKRRRR